jgi:hypothetical protein
MSGIVAMLLIVLVILAVLTARQLLALGAYSRRAGGLAEGWAALQSQNADDLTRALLALRERPAAVRRALEARRG